MTMREDIQEILRDIQCSHGNHEWGEYMCDSYGPYHLLHTRKCKYCGKIEASVKPFKHKTALEVKDVKIYDHGVR